MAVNWDIAADTHGRVVTCQRPILISMKAEEINVSHFKCELQIKDTGVTQVDMGWIDTGIRVNAYSDDGGQIYQANFAPYCRNYFKLSSEWVSGDPYSQVINNAYDIILFPGFENNDWNHMFRRQFRVKIWPVIFTQDENLVEEQDNYKWNREFMVFDTNINGDEQTSIFKHDNIRMDDFINGWCNGGYYSNTYGDHAYRGDRFSRLLTNMPGVVDVTKSSDDMIQTINMNDHQGFFVAGMGYAFDNTMRYKRHITITDLNGVETTYTFTGVYGSPYFWFDTNNVDILYFCWDLLMLQAMIQLEYGATYPIINASYELTCKHIKQWFTFETVADGTLRTSPSMEFNISDKKNDGMGCNRTRFLFKNSRGLIDFFNCYGEKSKKVSISGNTYMKQHNVARNNNYMAGGLIKSPGQHSVSNLWNNRVEEYEIITQPIPISWAKWLEELIASPNVWIEVNDENVESDDTDNQTSLEADDYRYRTCQKLVPIVIDKGSYDVFTTSDHMHYISFKYIVSNENIVSKAF
tara:strand:- start:1012 stop:2580 length:1569 start_codon:yes stop_codon:yes gene_type:complete